jgi:hypothetical protein
MRETPGSIMVYLLLVGTVGGLLNVIGIFDPQSSVAAKVICAAGFVVALGYIYGGAACKSLIANNPQRLVAVLVLGATYTIAWMLILFIITGGDVMSNPPARAGVVRAGIGLAITAYLLTNVQRLAREAKKPQPLPR